VLAAAALVVQGHADVVLPIGPGQAKPVSCNFITVAATGERKTACDTEALWSVRKHEAKLREKHDGESLEYTNDKLAYEKARETILKRGKGDRIATRVDLAALGPPPVSPLDPLLTCPEPTFEGLCRFFASGWPSLGVFATEGGQFIGGHGMSDDNKLKTAAALSGLWDGEPVRRVRGGDGVIVLPGRRLAAHLMAQPAVADLLFRDPMLADQGLLSRLLVTAPDSTAGSRFYREEDLGTDGAIKRYGARILSLLEERLPMVEGKSNELKPRLVPLSHKARQIWIDFADHIEKAIGPNGELEPVRGLANKLPEHAARLAAVLTLVRNLDAVEVVAAEMEAGIALAEHYATEAMRLFGASQVNSDLYLAQRLLDWLHHRWAEEMVSLPDIYQKGPNAIRDKDTAAKMVAILEDHGWVVRAAGGVVAGQRRRDAWWIVKV
jgi:hypothetical protein